MECREAAPADMVRELKMPLKTVLRLFDIQVSAAPLLRLRCCQVAGPVVMWLPSPPPPPSPLTHTRQLGPSLCYWFSTCAAPYQCYWNNCVLEQLRACLESGCGGGCTMRACPRLQHRREASLDAPPHAGAPAGAVRGDERDETLGESVAAGADEGHAAGQLAEDAEVRRCAAPPPPPSPPVCCSLRLPFDGCAQRNDDPLTESRGSPNMIAAAGGGAPPQAPGWQPGCACGDPAGTCSAPWSRP